MQKNNLKLIENFAKEKMNKVIAHDFEHVMRVRKWALKIAKNENYENLYLVETAALLHDIGRNDLREKSDHGKEGTEIAAEFLKVNKIFSELEIKEIKEAIFFHNKYQSGKGKLAHIVKDADILDLLGAIGIMRACTSHNFKPEFDPQNPKGETWNYSNKKFSQRFDKKMGIGNFISDQINFQISCFGNIKTKSAKKMAKPLKKFMQKFLKEIEYEILD